MKRVSAASIYPEAPFIARNTAAAANAALRARADGPIGADRSCPKQLQSGWRPPLRFHAIAADSTPSIVAAAIAPTRAELGTSSVAAMPSSVGGTTIVTVLTSCIGTPKLRTVLRNDRRSSSLPHAATANTAARASRNAATTESTKSSYYSRAMVLSDRTIREAVAAGRIVIDPLDDNCIQPSSVDLRLDNLFRVFLNHTMKVIDVKADQEDLTELVKVPEDQYFVLHPGEFVLGSTAERVRLPHDLVARIEGKSSLGRLGLLIHSTAGFVDPGFDGHLTLELANVANLPILLYPGMKIGQISFLEMTTEADNPYGSTSAGSKYQGQRGPTPSRYFENFRDKK